jgi:hypothetical protein
MSLLTVVKDVCAVVGVNVPTSVFSGINDNRTMQEMVSLANEMAQRIAYDTREWQRLKQVKVFVGDGYNDIPSGTVMGTTGHLLPANFKRLLLNSNVWRSTQTQTPMRFIPDHDEWLQRRLQQYSDARGEWTLIGGNMEIYPTLMGPVDAVLAETVTFVYLDKNCISSGGGFTDTFANDFDTFVLDERLLKLGMIWQWKAYKGTNYQEDMGTYGDALVLAMGNDSPAPIMVGRGTRYAGTEAVPSWPY